MQISDLIEQLQKLKDDHGDLEVLLQGYDDNICSVAGASFEEVEDDNQYPEDWQMPKGFKFVNIRTFG